MARKRTTPPQGANGKFVSTGAPQKKKLKTLIVPGARGGSVTLYRVEGGTYLVTARLGGRDCPPLETPSKAEANDRFNSLVVNGKC